MTTAVEGNLMIWAESGFHERWINKDYSIIKSYNFETQLLYSEYTADGYRAKEIPVDPASWQEAHLDKPGDIRFHVEIASGQFSRQCCPGKRGFACMVYYWQLSIALCELCDSMRVVVAQHGTIKFIRATHQLPPA